ncbi:ribbon-helix-helix domain-containing protein [Roseateles sp. LYH14W]|uniref:Type II toxin-antitoxin system ParD family antitoxin n=1 Tax=Pelomonas parva TaxID=3299032 RepID=A0ABW7EZF4_9BURK
MNIFLPQAMRDFVEQRAVQCGLESGSEYVCELIRRDQGREALRVQVLAGAESPPAVEMTPAWFASLRGRAQ